MTKDERVQLLVETVINGNRIDSPSVYDNYLRKTAVVDIYHYLFAREIRVEDLVWKNSPDGKPQAFSDCGRRLSKLEIFARIKKAF